MSIKARAHIIALQDLLELMSIAALIALVSDAGWCIRDMYTAGHATIGMLCVLTGLLTATSITAYAVIKYHKNQVHGILKDALLAKLKLCKAKQKGREKSAKLRIVK